MKRRTMILAALLAVLLLCGCTPAGSGVAAPPAGGGASRPESEPRPAQPVRMALVLPEGTPEYFALSLAHAKAQLKALAAAGDFEYDLKTAAGPAAMAEALEGALAFAPDVVLLWPWEDTAALAPAARDVLDAGTRLVLYGGQIEGVEPTATILGDDPGVGKWTGQYLLKTFAGELEQGATVGYLRFCGGQSEVSRLRSEGMDEAVAALGYAGAFAALAPDIDTGWEAASAKAEMAAWLYQATDAEREQLKFVVTQEDALAMAVLEAVAEWRAENSGPLGLRLVTGVGGSHALLERFDDPLGASTGAGAGPDAGASTGDGEEDAASGGADEGQDGQPSTEAPPGAAPAGLPEEPPLRLVTYHYSPAFIRQAILLAHAAARGAQYDGQDPTGKTFTIPTIEIDHATVNAFRAGREYAADALA